MPADFLAAEAGPILLVFLRVGAALMLMPGVGEQHVPAPLRLVLALILSLLLAPALAAACRLCPACRQHSRPSSLKEILAGILLGLVGRLCLAALHVGGSVIAMQSGLSAASLFDPHEGAQSTVPATFLTAAAMALLFAADFHHLLLRAVAASYAVLPAGAGPRRLGRRCPADPARRRRDRDRPAHRGPDDRRRSRRQHGTGRAQPHGARLPGAGLGAARPAPSGACSSSS